MGKIDLGAAFNKGWELFSKNMVQMIVGALLVYLIGIFSLGILMPIMAGGLFIMIRKSWQGETVAIGDVFAGFSNFGTLFLGGLLVLAASLVGTIACVVGLFFTMPIVMFLFPLIVDRGMGAGEAFKANFQAFKENLGGMIVLNIIVGLLIGAGNAAVYIGGLFTMPFGMCILYAAYHQVFAEAAPAAQPVAAPVEPK